MKKIIFILTILAWSGILILLSFSREYTNQKENTVAIDFSEWEKLYNWDTEKKAFAEIGLNDPNKWGDAFYFHRFSPIDGIYYRSGDKKPFAFEKKEGVNLITFGSGLFICNIQTGLEKYEFHLNDAVVSPKGRGVFLVDTTQEQIKIFSFDTFLDTKLINRTDRSTIANFTLFPSLLFKHDPRNTLELRGADILRISTIDSIRYVDMKNKESSIMLFSWRNAKKDESFFDEVQKDITARITAFVAVYASIVGQDSRRTANSFFNTTNALLINGSKKEVFLKNTLTENIAQLLNNPTKKQYIDTLKGTVSEMKELSPDVYSDGISILKKYYYVTTFSHFAGKDGIFDFSWQEPPLLSEAEKIITNNTKQKQGEYYMHLSNLFSVYYFLSLDTQELNDFYERILQKILDNKVLSKDEFLPFAFFVTQYLSTGPAIPNEDTMLIISHLFQITNDYYTNNKTNEAKLATITSTTFYNYTRIFSKIYSVFNDTFVEKTPNGMLLKKEYIEGDSTNINQNFIDAFIRVIGIAKKDAENKKDALYSKNSFQQNSWVTDSYALLKKTLGTFDTFISMFGNYPKYLNDFHLDDSNRTARGILIEKWDEMSMEALETYMKNFNNVDISSLQVMNNFKKDGFYEIKVNILGSAFNFKLWEQNHILADISYDDTFWKKHAFSNITIPLDQKEEQLKELFLGSDDPINQYRYDFRNFFETTFLKGDNLASSVQETAYPVKDQPSAATPEIQLFIQKELLDKDFKNIADFLPIRFKNINASIGEGSYIIKLSNIEKAFRGENTDHSVEIEGSYIFNRHAFSRLSFKVRREGDAGWYEFNGTPIEILPARIPLLSLPDNIKNLGYYIDTIRSSYTDQQSIVIDLIGKKVLLDKVPYIPKFPVP